MFVNVILAKYEELSEMDALPITVHHLKAFRDAWKKVDPAAKRWVHDEDMQRLLNQLPRQIGFDDLKGEDEIQLTDLRLPNLPDGAKGKCLHAVAGHHGSTNLKAALRLPFDFRWIPSGCLCRNRHGTWGGIQIWLRPMAFVSACAYIVQGTNLQPTFV